MIRTLFNGTYGSGKHGGVETVLVSLLKGFRDVPAELIHGTVAVSAGDVAWIEDNLPPSWTVLELPKPTGPLVRRWAKHLRAVPGADPILGRLRSSGPLHYSLPDLPPQARAIGAHVVHNPTPFAWRTELPSVVQPHDFQHEHLTHNFSREDLATRRAIMRQLVDLPSRVVVGTKQVRQDALAFMNGLDASRIDVIPLAPIYYRPQSDPRISSLVGSHPFVLYPAVNWSHKNHASLLQAVGALRSKGVPVRLVLTGSRAASGVDLAKLVSASGLREHVIDLGYVSPHALAYLYKIARLTVVPTAFEAASYPAWEAFTYGCPVAISAVTSIREQCGDAALYFDPGSPRDIASCIETLWTDATLRAHLISKGRERVQPYTPSVTAWRFLASYNRAVGLQGPANEIERQFAAEAPAF